MKKMNEQENKKDILQRFTERGENKVYQVGSIVIDYITKEDKFYFSINGYKPKEIELEKVIILITT